MLFQGFGEDVSAITIGDEVEFICNDRMKHGLDGRKTGVADRSRRQTVIGVGIIGGVGFQIGAGYCTAQSSFPIVYADAYPYSGD